MKKTLTSILLGLIHFFVSAQTEFITTWKTDNPGSSADNQITVPTFIGETYNYTVDWGDGNSDTNVTGSITHTYNVPGIYQVSIEGTFPRIYFNESGDKDKILNIKQWGNIQWTSMESAFAGCTNLDVVALDLPNLSNVLELTRMFWNCISLVGNESFENWDTSNIYNTANMFRNAELFNQDIGGWNVSNVTSMAHMFINAKAFNHNLNAWDVSNVAHMQAMFSGASNFNGDIESWNVSKVINMAGMFSTTPFNRDISGWDVGRVEYMDRMFYANKEFNQDITSWNVGNVVSMAGMFDWTESFDQNIGVWDISNVTDMTDMFTLSTGLSYDNYNNILIGWNNLPSLQPNVRFDTTYHEYCVAESARQNLIDTHSWTINDMGKNCVDEQRPFITKWKTDNYGVSEDNQLLISTSRFGVYDYNVDWGDGTTDTGIKGEILHTYPEPGTYEVKISGYYPATGFSVNEELDRQKLITIVQWGDLVWENPNFAFSRCINMDMVAEDFPDLSKADQLVGMFFWCHSLVGNESFGDWDVSNVKRFGDMFGVCYEFNQDISNWDMSNAEDIGGMFMSATSFNQDISDWDVSNVVYMGSTFNNAQAFNQDISNWDVSRVEEMIFMFRFAESFDQSLGDWDVSNVTTMSNMFLGSGISTFNYDETLMGWSSLPSLQSNVNFDAGDSQFCESEEARLFIINTYGWTIVDGGRFFGCNQDNDNDGVLDQFDFCLGTRIGAVVDEYGCEIIPADAIQVYVLTPSCVDSADGAVNILMNVPGHLMDISISGDSYSNQFDDVASEQEFKIGGLAPGTYSISITVPENLFEQTVGITINSLSSITGKRASTDSKNGVVVYEVAGSENYDVLINGEKKSYSFENTGRQNILIENLYGQSEVSISGENACQGIVSDSFFIGDAIQVYPTITSSRVNIMTNKSVINTMVFGLDGRLVRAINYDQNNKSIDVSTLKSGIYFLQMEVEGHVETVKIVKR